MNIFVLSEDPEVAAQSQCDKHVPKMFLESVQLISNCFESGPYRKTHLNHPCSVWARESKENLSWLIEHALALSDEYTFRFAKTHKSLEALSVCVDSLDSVTFSSNRTPFPKCMPEAYIKPCPVESYRAYYLGDKVRFAKWNRGRPAPLWFEPLM